MHSTAIAAKFHEGRKSSRKNMSQNTLGWRERDTIEQVQKH
jgi:hypothetical protein